MSVIVVIDHIACKELRKRFWLYGLFCLGLLAGGYWLLYSTWEPELALRWLVFASFGMVYAVWRFWFSLGENFRPGEHLLLPDLGAGNVISLVRGALIASLCGFLFSPWPQGWLAWLPGIIYTIAAIMDGVDGIAARLNNHVTRLGEILDVSFDSLGVLIVSLLLAQSGKAPAWFALVGLARYLFLAGLWLRHQFGLPVYDLPPSGFRRMIAGFTFGIIFTLLWPILEPPATAWAASFWALPFLINFFLDWLVVSGVLKPDYGAPFAPVANIISAWLPIFLRGATVLLLSYSLWFSFMNGKSVAYLNPWQYFIGTHLSWTDVIMLAAIASGFAVRSFSLAGLFLIGIHQLFEPAGLVQHVLIYLYMSLVILGSGLFSLWRPEDRLIESRIGERAA